MRAPEFWRRGGALPALLSPLGWVYGAVTRARLARGRPGASLVPVLCVGNLLAGGAGKTPVALSIGARLARSGVAVHFLSRGYGGQNPGPVRVDPDHHDALAVGDEALLLAACAPTWVARDRAAGARAAAAQGAGLIVMDDGFQNPGIHKDLSLLVVDGGYGFGNGRMMPAGPLREPVEAGLKRTDAVVLIGPDETGAAKRIKAVPGGAVPILAARARPGPEAADIAGKPVLAFAGIARPDKFFDTLRALGCPIVGAHSFPDHYAYKPEDIERLTRQAEAAGALAVTTAKDRVRLPQGSAANVRVLTIDIEWEDEAALDVILSPLLKGREP
jgi:tetraacyldisaccharide 4'-kinase